MAELIDNSGFQEFTAEDLKTPGGIAKLNFIIRQLAQNIPSNLENVRIFQGYGTPEASVTAGVGSVYMRIDGGTGTTIYFKESGTGNTGWSPPAGGVGGIIGPSSSIDNDLVSFNGTTGQIIKDSGILSTNVVTATAALTDNFIVRGDGGAKGVQTSVLSIDDTTGNVTGPAAGFKITGGTGTTADLSLQTTSGVGAGGADIHFLVGNAGATEAATILNDGKVGIGTAAPSTNLDVESSIAVGGIDINNAASDTQVVLIAHMNGADTSTTFTDSSSFARAMSANGAAQIATAQSVFGGASGVFNGAKTTFVSIADSSSFDFGAGDFTIHLWYYTTTVTGTHGIFSQWGDSGGNGSFYLYHQTATIKFNYSTNGASETVITSGITLSANTWTHITVVRDGATIRFFKDGVNSGTGSIGTSTIFNSTRQINISGYQDGGSVDHSVNGYIDEVIVIKGRAEWTADFTPPTSEATAGSFPRLKFQIAGATKFSLGVDGGDSNKFKIGTTDVATNERFIINDAGLIGIRQTIPTAYLHIAAGTATASTAPLKLTSGTVNTSAEAGAIEYNDKFQVTESDTTRRYVVQAAASTKTTAGAPYTNDGYVVIRINGTDVKVMTTA